MPRPPSCLCGKCRKCRERERFQKFREENPDYYREKYQQRKAKQAEYQREKYRTDPVERQKVKARRAAAHAIASGKMERLPCEVCGDAKSEAHHDDYDQPLEVRFLCKQHHDEHHINEQRKALLESGRV